MLCVDGVQDGLSIVEMFFPDGMVDGRCEDGQVVGAGILPEFVELGVDLLNGFVSFLQDLAALGLLLGALGFLLSGSNFLFGGDVWRRGRWGWGAVCGAAHEREAEEEKKSQTLRDGSQVHGHGRRQSAWHPFIFSEAQRF